MKARLRSGRRVTVIMKDMGYKVVGRKFKYLCVRTKFIVAGKVSYLNIDTDLLDLLPLSRKSEEKAHLKFLGVDLRSIRL